MLLGGFSRLAWAKLNAFLTHPSLIFNLLKLPVMWQFYEQQTANPGAALLFVVFWLLLTFCVARWGCWYFWTSVFLQIAFVGFPEVRAANFSNAPDLLDLSTNWPIWLFTAGISLEILEWTKNLKNTNAPAS